MNWRGELISDGPNPTEFTLDTRFSLPHSYAGRKVAILARKDNPCSLYVVDFFTGNIVLGWVDLCGYGNVRNKEQEVLVIEGWRT